MYYTESKAFHKRSIDYPKTNFIETAITVPIN